MSNNSNNQHRQNNNRPNHGGKGSHSNNKEQPIRKFTLGTKELDDKTCEFEYDRGQYTIYDLNGETRTEVFRSKNMQEAYTKWNVYIGRKKERPSRKREEENPEATVPSGSDKNTVSGKNGQKKTDEPKTDSHKNESDKNGEGNRNRNRNHRNRNRNQNQKSKAE